MVANPQAMTLGERVKELRDRVGLTQLELAAAAGVSRNTIYRLEADRTPAEFETVVKVAAALSVDVASLMDMKLPIVVRPAPTLDDIVERLEAIERATVRMESDLLEVRDALRRIEHE